MKVKICNYKNGFRTYLNDVPTSRKPVGLSMAIHQRNALNTNEKYDKIKSYSLGDGDIREMIPTLKILRYPQLLEYDNIEDALDEKGRLLILYLTESEHSGHWVSLLKQKRNGEEYIEYFDPYGKYKPDEESSWLTKNELREYQQDTKYLTKLLRKSGLKITYNKAPFQSEERNINTCGRHCTARLYYKHLSLPQYTKMLQKSGMSPDDFVSKFTYGLIGK
jgi:hypothetical protein